MTGIRLPENKKEVKTRILYKKSKNIAIFDIKSARNALTKKPQIDTIHKVLKRNGLISKS